MCPTWKKEPRSSELAWELLWVVRELRWKGESHKSTYQCQSLFVIWPPCTNKRLRSASHPFPCLLYLPPIFSFSVANLCYFTGPPPAPPTRWGIQYLLVAKLQYATANGGITVRWGPGHAFQEIFKLLVWSKKKERNINVILTWRAGGRFPVQSAPWLFANCAITFSLAAILQSSSFPTLLRLVPPLRKFSEIPYPSVEKCSLYRVCADYDTPKPTEICRKA